MSNIEEIFYIKKKRKLKYTCSLCKRKFHYKKSYEKHVIICKQVNTTENVKITITENDGKNKNNENNTNQPTQTTVTHNNITQTQPVKSTTKTDTDTTQKMNDILDADDPLPSQREMFTMLQELMVKYNDLQADFDKMKGIMNQRKKRIDILAYLNDPANISDEIISFTEWLDSFTVTREELEYMFQYNYISGIVKALIKTLPLETSYKHSIKCFDQKKNIYFKYDICNDQTENDDEEDITISDKKMYKWTIMDDDDFNKVIMKMNMRFLKEFQNWKNDNIEEIENDDNFHEIYINNMRIVLGSNQDKERRIKIIKSKIYQYLKCNLKNITQYEFTI